MTDNTEIKVITQDQFDLNKILAELSIESNKILVNNLLVSNPPKK